MKIDQARMEMPLTTYEVTTLAKQNSNFAYALIDKIVMGYDQYEVERKSNPNVPITDYIPSALIGYMVAGLRAYQLDNSKSFSALYHLNSKAGRKPTRDASRDREIARFYEQQLHPLNSHESAAYATAKKFGIKEAEAKWIYESIGKPASLRALIKQEILEESVAASQKAK